MLYTYRKTLAVIDDLVTNGVPLAPYGHCILPDAHARELKDLAKSMMKKRDALCAWAILLQCNPVPTECL